MPNVNPYAAGKNVYRGGSNVATMGQVDPIGYVNRELNNRRSQLAQGMLKNLTSNGQQQQQNQNPQQLFLDPRHVSLLAVKQLGGSTYGGY
jgi:hypothetical protein